MSGAANTMQFTRLGRTGLTVSRLCLGCMTYGVPARGSHPWTLPEDQSRPLIRQAVELGINFFDTANNYSDGTSEEITGRALRDFARRDEIVVATKVRFGNRRGPNIGGLSRKTIFEEIDGSLKRLGMDHVDLYQIHRWDPATPIEETMEALHDVVKAGKARYIGASSMHAWQLAKANAVARQHGWTAFVSMQPELSLLYREEEREMLPLCQDQGVGRDPLEPAGARPPGAALGCRHTAHRQRCVWGHAVQAHRGQRRPGACRAGPGGGAAWCTAGGRGPGLAAAEARGDGADHRRVQARAL